MLQRVKTQALVPCTVQQVLQAQQIGETFKIGDVEIHQVGCYI